MKTNFINIICIIKENLQNLISITTVIIVLIKQAKMS